MRMNEIHPPRLYTKDEVDAKVRKVFDDLEKYRSISNLPQWNGILYLPNIEYKKLKQKHLGK